MGTRTSRRKGFSLTELMICMAVAALFLAVAVPTYQASINKANVARAVSDITAIASAIDRYVLANSDTLPGDLAEVDKADLVDPWGNPYVYLPLDDPGNRGASRKNRNLVPINTDYDLYSMGADGESRPPLTAAPSRDDVIRASNGQFYGQAQDY